MLCWSSNCACAIEGAYALQCMLKMAEAVVSSDGVCSSSTNTATKLSNRTFAMRHGESEANVQGVIVCDSDVGCSSYGLTDRGRAQVKEACRTLQSSLQPPYCLPDNVIVVSSDFKRTSETAEIVRDHFKATAGIRYEVALRERSFGQLHLTSDANYQKVWDLDYRDPQHTEYGCESIMSVALRTSRLLRGLEEEYKGKAIVLVSHGDTLQILSTLFFGTAPNEHRTVPSLAPSQVRELIDTEAMTL